jgi:excisionase family DNA binding protein
VTGKPEKLLTVEEVAELLGVHPQTVYELVRSGTLAARKIGRVWRVRPSDVTTFQAPRGNQ